MTVAVVQGIGVPELLIVLGIVLLVLGPKRLPGLGRQLGSGIREFKDGITRRHEAADEAEPAELTEPAPAAEPVSGEVVTDRDR